MLEPANVRPYSPCCARDPAGCAGRQLARELPRPPPRPEAFFTSSNARSSRDTSSRRAAREDRHRGRPRLRVLAAGGHAGSQPAGIRPLPRRRSGYELWLAARPRPAPAAVTAASFGGALCHAPGTEAWIVRMQRESRTQPRSRTSSGNSGSARGRHRAPAWFLARARRPI